MQLTHGGNNLSTEWVLLFLLVRRLVGSIRLFAFHDRNPTVRNLRELLEAELKLLPDDPVPKYVRQRQRPR